MRKLIAGASLALIVSGVGGTAFAGEVKGNGEYKGVNVHASLCAYSGLNDGVQGQTDRKTQTPKDAAPGSAAFGWAPDPSDPTFILTCNPNGPVGG
jgi:hypothetical protein